MAALRGQGKAAPHTNSNLMDYSHKAGIQMSADKLI